MKNCKQKGLDFKEPLDVDFYVDPRPLTKAERKKISQHISEYKAKMAKRKNHKVASKKNTTEVLK